MIYFVSNRQWLFEEDDIKPLSVEKSLTLLEKKEVLQLDVETNGLDPHLKKLKTLQLGYKDTQIVIDVETVDIQNYKEILQNTLLIGHHLKFDTQFLYNHNIIPRKIYDTMIVEQFLYLGYPTGMISFSLKSLLYRYLNVNMDKSIRETIVNREIDYSYIIYAAKDVEYLEEVMWKQVAILKTRKNAIIGAKLECDFVPVIAYLEWCGIKLDIDKWKAKMEEDSKNLKIAKDKLDSFIINSKNPKFSKYIYTEAQGDLFTGFSTDPQCTINWASSKQVIQIAKILGFNTLIKDKKTGENKDSVLEKQLKLQKGINDEFLKIYFDYQEHFKVVSSFGQGHLNDINPVTGRLHTQYKQLGATSGRMSSGSSKKNEELAVFKNLPKGSCGYKNMQQLPSNHATRSSFIGGENRLFCSCDFSALESRLGADIYQEKSMIDEFLYKSGDIHSLVASFCFEECRGKSTEEIKKNYSSLRKKAKPVGFSQQFGGSAYAIQSSLGCTLQEAEDIAAAYNKGFSGIANFKNKGSKFVREHGYIIMNPDTGHRMYWWDWEEWKERQLSFNNKDWEGYRKRKHENPHNPEAKEVSMHFKAASKYDRLALNSVTQATGIIILKDAAINYFNWIVDNKYFNIIKINGLIHDEFNIDFPKDLESIVPKKLKEIMENSASKYCKSLPIPASAEVGLYWIH